MTDFLDADRSSSRDSGSHDFPRASRPAASSPANPTATVEGAAEVTEVTATTASTVAASSWCCRARSAVALWTVRLLLAVLTIASIAAATGTFWQVVASDGVVLLDYPLTALFAVLFGWIVLSFWTSTFGLLSILIGRRAAPLSMRPVVDPAASRRKGQTAILMPVYNESPERVFAGAKAMLAELDACGRGGEFVLYILSDTTNPDIWLAEERAWAKLADELPRTQEIFYRHRPKNVERKSGNIADFVTRWGRLYDHMIVLDADSLMSAETMIEMVRRMDADPKIGILQVPPTPIGRRSTLARLQQFSARFYSPAFLRGFGLWAGSDGNYWGHNAIIRTRAFLEHCDLPKLPGVAPMGGEILSHDFVEAALIRRGGYRVCLADDLAGSYEESPTTLLAYAQRDQRWCQGNMQHMKLLGVEGLHPCSRLHLAMGVMGYLASPLWLAFLLLSVAAAAMSPGSQTSAANAAGLMLFGVSMALLIAPKVYGLIVSLRTGAATEHGGFAKAALSVLLETIVSVFIAPIMMLDHTRFVLTTLSGRKVGWNAQDRDDGEVPLADGVGQRMPYAWIGLAVATLTLLLSPGLLLWLSPIVGGLILAPIITSLLGSSKLGIMLRDHNLLLIPEELEPPAVFRRREEAVRSPLPPGQFRDVIADPGFFALHVNMLEQSSGDVRLPPAARTQVLEAGPNGAELLTPQQRRDLLGDRQTLEQLHIMAMAK